MSIVKEFATKLEEDGGSRMRKLLATELAQKKIPVKSILGILKHSDKAAVRFTWLLGDIGEMAPDLLKSAVAPLFKKRNELKITGLDRTLAKMLWRAGIPKEIEGEAVDQLFKWLYDPEARVAVKVFALSALCNCAKKYPELKNELLVAIKDQEEKTSIAFKVRARDIRKELNKI